MKMKKLLFLLLLLACPLVRFQVSTLSAQNADSLTFAVLGNSISTYYDYLPSGYAVYYSQDRERNYGFQVGDTWWMQLSRVSGLSFLANASWSGSRVACDVLNSNSPFLSNHRVKALGRAGNPDFIFIAGGTNDWNVAKVPLGEYRTKNFTDSVSFRGAYQRLLYKLTTQYPESRIVCLSIFPRGNGINDKNAQEWSQADANASIKYIAKQFGQYYIDCTTVPWSSNWSASTFDRLHPTAYGGTQLANQIYKTLLSQKIITRDLKRSNEVSEAERLLDLSFTADGIVNHGVFETKVGKHGAAATFYDARNDTYYGCTKARSSDYFYATYDEGSPLANAFNGSVTWEMLVRLDALGDQVGNINRTCIMGSEQDGGWSFYNSDLASTFSYTHKSGVKSSVKSIAGDSILVPGKFYHLVVTMDRMSHTIRYFVNGKLVCTGTRAGTDMPMPLCGSPKGRKGMWICLGGDVPSGIYTGGAENSSACSFVFARIYDGALAQKAALALYNDDVKRFTEPQTPLGTELLMDCSFTADGAVNHAPSFRDKPIEMVGEVSLAYNAGINLYEAKFDRDKTQFFKYNIGDDLPMMRQLSDAYSVEVYCRCTSALPSGMMRPLGFLNGYGFGLQMNTKGNIGYTTTTQGNKADNSFAKTQWSWIGEGSLTDEYTHYVIVYDRTKYRSQLYVNGVLMDTRWLTFKECPVYEWTPSTWLAIGGDAKGNYDAATQVGLYPFMGDIASVRIYGTALDQKQISELAGIHGTQEKSFTMGANGYVGVCLPYIWQVPEGCTAFIVSQMEAPSVMLRPIAQAGDFVPYGTPVILKGEAKSNVTLTAECISQIDDSRNEQLSNSETISLANLLAGTYPGRTFATGECYYLKAAGTSPYVYRAAGDITIQPFSCYMPLAASRTYFKLVEEETTGMDELRDEQLKMNNSSGNAIIYDLSGRKVSTQPKTGIFIKDGRKQVAK